MSILNYGRFVLRGWFNKSRDWWFYRSHFPRQRNSSMGRPLLVGYFSSPIGLGEAIRLMRAGFEESGCPVAVEDITPSIQADRSVLDVVEAEPDDSRGPIIIHVNPPEFSRVFRKLSKKYDLQNRKIIAMWAWELSRPPASWKFYTKWVDEIWAPSKFVKRSFDLFSTVPVIACPYPIEAKTKISTRWREKLHLESGFLVFTSCDPRSSVTRKNLLGMVEAFHKGVGDASDARLIVKIVGDLTDFSPTVRSALHHDKIIVIEKFLSPNDMMDLIASVDVVLNLHRAEGFGLLPAQASAMGVPVVTTAWSGVEEFIEAPNIFGVNFDMVPVANSGPVYQGVFGRKKDCWADPDLDHAAQQLKQVYGLSMKERENLQQESVDWWRSFRGVERFWQIVSPQIRF